MSGNLTCRVVFTLYDQPPLYAGGGDNMFQVEHEAWCLWLAENSSFRFESRHGSNSSFTARKHGRDSGDFWYAYRKIDGKLKNAYLGKSEALTADKLLKAATKLSQTEVVLTDQQLGNGYAQLDLTDTLNNAHAMESIALSEQVAELRAKLEVSEKERCHMEKLLGDLADKVRGREKGYKDNGFSQGMKDIIALAESRGL